MSKLIDNFITESAPFNCSENGYIIKQLRVKSIRRNIKDAWRILIGKSFAVHYKRDEK